MISTHSNQPSILSLTQAKLFAPTNFFIHFGAKEIEQSISNRFEKIVQKYANKIAIHTIEHQWTYDELDRRANHVAHKILAICGCGNGRIILLFAHKSEMIAAILGVLKAGKTYVPVDPKYPAKIISNIVFNSQPAAILTNNETLPLTKELFNDILVINLDKINATVPKNTSTCYVSANDIAYILYTSGSTGEPKGIFQSHRNVLHHIRNYTNHLHIGAKDKLTLLSSYCFDTAMLDMFSALLNGATLYPRNLKIDGLNNLAHWLIKNKITVFHLKPSVYRYFLKTLAENEVFQQIRLLVLGGEEVYRSDVEQYKKYFSSECILVNLMGSTESSTSLMYSINKDTHITDKVVPSGYSVDYTDIFLLNEASKQVEDYDEIVVKSPYVALGYWGKPEFTKKSFISDIDSEKRIYRTGDLGKKLPNGSLIFVGRKDSQVKIRGFRVELREIEATLAEHPLVHAAVVLAQKNNTGEKKLVAYIVARIDKVLTVNELRKFVGRNLPDYMVPSIFVMLDTLPLTPNGKVDRRALPAPNQVRQESEETFVAPRNALESQLSKIWEKVLKVQPIGVHDNFFDIGGHSLLAVTLLSRIEKKLGKSLSLITLFQAPSIAQQAELLREKGNTVSWCALEAIQPQGTRPPLFFIGSTNYARALTSVLETNQPVYGLNLFGLQPSNGTTPSLTVEGMARQYLQDIQTVQPQGPYYLCAYCGDARVALEMAQQLHAVGQQIALLAFIDVIWEKQNRYYRHWYNFLKFGPKYLSHKIKGQLKSTKSLLELSLSKLSAKWHRHKNITLPLKLQHMMLINEFYKALGNYVPKPYSGSITLFLSSDWRFQYSGKLNQLAIDGVEIYEISGYHDTLFNSPQVELLGEQLRKCLDKATNLCPE
jgi:amino acid adenylation domain-containing protein